MSGQLSTSLNSLTDSHAHALHPQNILYYKRSIRAYLFFTPTTCRYAVFVMCTFARLGPGQLSAPGLKPRHADAASYADRQ